MKLGLQVLQVIKDPQESLELLALKETRVHLVLPGRRVQLVHKAIRVHRVSQARPDPGDRLALTESLVQQGLWAHKVIRVHQE